MCELLGGMMCSATFYLSTGAQSKAIENDGCAIEGVWEQLGRCIAVGVVSGVVSKIPTRSLRAYHTRRFVVAGSARRKSDMIRTWFRIDVGIYSATDPVELNN